MYALLSQKLKFLLVPISETFKTHDGPSQYSRKWSAWIQIVDSSKVNIILLTVVTIFAYWAYYAGKFEYIPIIYIATDRTKWQADIFTIFKNK